jgi:PHD/YefM family antitoxin component YafN of YafNO toxin-antitoxin module
MNTQIRSADEVRRELRNMMDELSTGGGAIIVERYRKPMIVLINYDDYLSVELLLSKPRQPAQ